MAELEDDEDLTRFDLDALIAAANEIAEGMKKNGATKEDAEKLRKVALEIHKKSEPRAASTPAVAPPAQVGYDAVVQ